ncbi:MAG: element excision factor XisI family protein [Bacteroidia bacterium]
MVKCVNSKNTVKEELVDELQAKGIAASEIVLAFLPPEMRVHSRFAVS